jgi:hypothetical protein
VTNRRRFIAGAGLTVLGAGSLTAAPAAFGKGDLSTGDAAILRFLAAAEILETDLWQQYNELCGIQDKELPHGTGNKAFTAIMAKFDDDMPQYVHDNTEDEFTHFTFINAYLKSRGAQTVNLDAFRTLPGSTVTGSAKLKRLTNLMELTLDTSWYTRYRSRHKNPDLGDTFPQAVPGLAKGKFPAIPRTDADTSNKKHLQAIANTAAFHFATIEQGGSSASKIRRSCASCSASGRRRRCTSRPGVTSPATRSRSRTRPTASSSRTSTRSRSAGPTSRPT